MTEKEESLNWSEVLRLLLAVILLLVVAFPLGLLSLFDTTQRTRTVIVRRH